MPTTEPTCPTNYSYSEVRGCCEYGPFDDGECTGLGISSGTTGTVSQHDESSDRSFFWDATEQKCKNLGVVGRKNTSTGRYISGFYENLVGSYVPFSGMTGKCQNTFNPAWPGSGPIYDWDGCQCYAGSGGSCSGTFQPPWNCHVGCPTDSDLQSKNGVILRSRKAHIFNLTTGLWVLHDPIDCCEEVDVWACAAGTDEYLEGSIYDPDPDALTCTPECLTPTCPFGYTFNPSTGLCEKPGGKLMDFDRGLLGILGVAFVNGSGALVVNRYDDSLPESVAASLTVEASNVTSCGLQVLKDGKWLLMYSQSNAIKYRFSRDAGRSFSVSVSVPSVSTAESLVFKYDERKGIIIAVWQAGAALKYKTGVINDAGNDFSWSSEKTAVASGVKALGEVRSRNDSVWELGYVNTSNAPLIVYCRSLNSDGTGTWA
jgi:hypothetical protein